MNFDIQVRRLVELIKVKAGIDCELPLLSWTDKASQVLASMFAGNPLSETELLALESTEEITHLIYIYHLRRFADEEALKKYSGLDKTTLIQACSASVPNSAEYKAYGCIVPRIQVGETATSPTIFVDVTNTAATRNRTGIQRVVRELANLLQERDDIVFIAYDRNADLYARALYKDTEFAIIQDSSISFNPGDIYVDIDASWGDNLHRWTLYRTLRSNGIRILNVHYDATPLLLPAHSHNTTVLRYLEHFFAASTFSDRFICISKAVERDYRAITKAVQMRTAPSTVIPLGSSFGNQPPPPGKVPEKVARFCNRKFVLCVGTVEPRKNYAHVVDAFEKLEQLGLALVLVGKRGWEKEELFSKLEKLRTRSNNFLWLENADDTTLSYLYRSCFLYLTAAHYEGYGLPVVEALSNGCVVVTTDGGALPELVGAHGYVFNLMAPGGLIDIAGKLVNDPSEYLAAKERVKNFKEVNWNDSYVALQSALDDFLLPVCEAIDPLAVQLAYISIRPTSLRRSIESFLRFGFAGSIVVLTNRATSDEVQKLLQRFSLNYQIVNDEDLFIGEEIPRDHVARNFQLRKRFYASGCIADAFVALDDDAILLKPLPTCYYTEGGKYAGRYFCSSMEKWNASSFSTSSYDNGQWETSKLLRAFFWPDRSYSSHQPQIKDKRLVQEIFSEFEHLGAGAIDEWSLYFNVAATRYPNKFAAMRTSTLYWPHDFSSWLPEWLLSDIYFENHYPSDGDGDGDGDGDKDTSSKINRFAQDYDKYYAQSLLNKIVGSSNCLSPGFGKTWCGFPGIWIGIGVSENVSGVGYFIKSADNVIVDGSCDIQCISDRAPLCVKLPNDAGEYELEIIEVASKQILGQATMCVFPWRGMREGA